MNLAQPPQVAAVPDLQSELQLQDWMHRALPLYAFIGIRVDSWRETLQCSVPLSANTRNHLGTMHAGVQWSAAETLGGIAYFANMETLGECLAVVRKVDIEFLKPATSAIRVRARFGVAELDGLRAALEARGKVEYPLDIEVLDAQDVTVSRARGHYYLRRRSSAGHS